MHDVWLHSGWIVKILLATPLQCPRNTIGEMVGLFVKRLRVTILDMLVAWCCCILCYITKLDWSWIRFVAMHCWSLFIFVALLFHSYSSFPGSWSRMIFGLQDNYKLMSRDEREERDYQHMQNQKQKRYVWMLASSCSSMHVKMTFFRGICLPQPLYENVFYVTAIETECGYFLSVQVWHVFQDSTWQASSFKQKMVCHVAFGFLCKGMQHITAQGIL